MSPENREFKANSYLWLIISTYWGNKDKYNFLKINGSFFNSKIYCSFVLIWNYNTVLKRTSDLKYFFGLCKDGFLFQVSFCQFPPGQCGLREDRNLASPHLTEALACYSRIHCISTSRLWSAYPIHSDNQLTQPSIFWALRI